MSFFDNSQNNRQFQFSLSPPFPSSSTHSLSNSPNPHEAASNRQYVMDGANNRAEALRWLTAAEKLLLARDLQGCRNFAIRARESDPILEAPKLLLVVVETLIAGDYWINNHHDWYAILQVPRYAQNMDVIATQYQRLVVILDPNRNRIPFSAEAFRLVCDAWLVLSDPSRKALYDNDLRFLTEPTTQLQLQQQTYHHYQQQHYSQHQNEQHYHYQQQNHHYQPNQQPQPLQFQPLQAQPGRNSHRSKDGRTAVEEERPSFNLGPESTQQTRTANELPHRVQTERVSTPQRQPTTTTEPTRSVPATEVPTFWTACPYCYVLYEYPKIYEDCTLKCQQCKRAFHAVMVPSPPVTEKATYFCTWGFFPVGCSGKFGRGRGQNVHRGPRVYYDDDDVFVEISSSDDESDDDWEKERRRARNSKGKTTGRKYITKAGKERGTRTKLNGVANANLSSDENSVGASVAEKEDGPMSTRKAAMSNAHDVAEMGQLDLNVRLSNEVEVRTPGVSDGSGTSNEAEENNEGIGFFEGLDDFLSTLPVLVADDRIRATLE